MSSWALVSFNCVFFLSVALLEFNLELKLPRTVVYEEVLHLPLLPEVHRPEIDIRCLYALFINQKHEVLN